MRNQDINAGWKEGKTDEKIREGGHDIYSVHPGEGSCSVALLKGSSPFFPLKGFFLFLGSFPDPM